MVEGSQGKEALKDIALFLVKFNILLIPFYAISYFNFSYAPLQILFTNLVAFVLGLMQFQVTTSDFFLFLGKSKFPIDISWDCVGWKSGYSLFALVFATPGKVKDKLKFLGIWIPVLAAINFFRVISTVVLGFKLGFQYIEPIHTFFWQGAMIGFVLLGWYFWLKRKKITKK